MTINIRKADLVGLGLDSEVCLIRIYDDGSLWLNHVEAELVDADGHYVGSLLMNDEVRLPLAKFRLEWKGNLAERPS